MIISQRSRAIRLTARYAQPSRTWTHRELTSAASVQRNNLGIFDDVKVELERERLVITVREKWTLIPNFEFATGTTLEDTFVLLGAAEYNAFGSATLLEGELSYEERGLNFSVARDQPIFLSAGPLVTPHLCSTL